MRSGTLRHFVELQRPIRADQPGGEPVVVWQLVKYLYVSMQGTGTEQTGSGQTEARLTWAMQAHFDPEIQASRRFVMGGRVFDIVSVAPAAGNVDLSVDIIASERVA